MVMLYLTTARFIPWAHKLYSASELHTLFHCTRDLNTEKHQAHLSHAMPSANDRAQMDDAMPHGAEALQLIKCRRPISHPLCWHQCSAMSDDAILLAVARSFASIALAISSNES